jgi:hypothetical protein
MAGKKKKRVSNVEKRHADPKRDLFDADDHPIGLWMDTQKLRPAPLRNGSDVDRDRNPTDNHLIELADIALGTAKQRKAKKQQGSNGAANPIDFQG